MLPPLSSLLPRRRRESRTQGIPQSAVAAGRISATEAAWKLGFETDHITILTSAGLLKHWAIRRQAP